MRAFKNEKGLSLVEVLAAIAILGIAFVGIMTIFPQMTIFNAKTETKLDTMNLARQEMANIILPATPPGAIDPDIWEGRRDILDPSIYETFQDKIPKVLENIPVKVGETDFIKDATNTDPDFERYKKTGKYVVEVDIYTTCEAFQPSSSAISMSCSDPDLTQLYKVHLKILEGSRLSSETYSYITYKVGKQNE